MLPNVDPRLNMTNRREVPNRGGSIGFISLRFLSDGRRLNSASIDQTIRR
jgi:hypothetical protein